MSYERNADPVREARIAALAAAVHWDTIQRGEASPGPDTATSHRACPALKLAIRAAGLRQNQLAARLALSPATVTCWVNGTAQPRLRLLRPLARILRLSTDQLLDLLQAADGVADGSTSPAGGE